MAGFSRLLRGSSEPPASERSDRVSGRRGGRARGRTLSKGALPVQEGEGNSLPHLGIDRGGLSAGDREEVAEVLQVLGAGALDGQRGAPVAEGLEG